VSVWQRLRVYTKRFVNQLRVDIDCVCSARFCAQQWEVVMGIALYYCTTTQSAIIAVGLTDVCVIIFMILFLAHGNAHRDRRSNSTINLYNQCARFPDSRSPSIMYKIHARRILTRITFRRIWSFKKKKRSNLGLLWVLRFINVLV